MLVNFSSRDKVRRTVVNFVVPFLKRRQEKVLKIGVYYICLYTML